VTRKEIAAELRALGLKKGDIVLLHSSFLSLGEVRNGPGEVIGAFLDVIGAEGTILAPAFGRLGVLADEVKRLPGAIVSSCPPGCVAACGPAAEELCKDHWKAETAHGRGTPYTRLAEKGGFICLLGVDQDRNTSLHGVEALLELPYLSTRTATVRDPAGNEAVRSYRFFPGPHRDFIGVDRILRESGAMKIRRIGDAQVRLIDSARMFEVLLREGRNRPDLVLCDNPACDDCVRQRAALYADEMAHEAFRLTASSRLAGRYIPEMIENLKRQGIAFVELDFVQGRICASLSAEKLSAAVRELRAEEIEVSGIRLPAVPDEPEALAEKLRAAGIGRAIVPLPGSAAAVKALQNAGLTVSPYNVAQTAVSAARDFAEIAKSGSGILFSFHAANFVKAGEKPFLGSYRNGRFGKIIGQLDLADCTWDGEPAALAEGNAEIRELVSILRCRNFSGYCCLGGGSGYPGDLKKAAGDFRKLLDSI